jgi:hypothetical protein
MKYMFIISLLLISIASCKKDDPDLLYPQKWELVKMIGNYTYIFTGNEMSWQEYYLLQADGTFNKYRTRDGITSEATGTYSKIQIDKESFLELIFETPEGIIASCYPDREYLHIKSSTSLSSTWSHCDGPGLIYSLAKK